MDTDKRSSFIALNLINLPNQFQTQDHCSLIFHLIDSIKSANSLRLQLIISAFYFVKGYGKWLTDIMCYSSEL